MCIFIYMYAYVYMCVFIYICVYIYMCVCIYIERDAHRILRHCSRSTTRGHASPIPLYHLSRLRT